MTSNPVVKELREHADAWGVPDEVPDAFRMSETAMAWACWRGAAEIDRLTAALEVAQSAAAAAISAANWQARTNEELNRLTARNAELVKALEEAQRDARRWRLARQYVSAMTVKGWQKMLDDGHAPSEEGNSVADDAVDQMIARAALKGDAT